jgi:hypothetical protein
MTELDIRAAVANGFAAPEQTAVETYSDNAMDRLGRWLQQADAVFAIAERICETSFVPTAYRKKPAEAAAAMLAGAELGFDPMASLRAFDNINGTPAPKAITQRAVVLGAGHEVETIEQSATRAVVRGRRKGATEWQTATWDIARAKRLPQFKTNPNYQNNPEAMLVARATSEVCRWVAPDAIMGMPYSAEEISDHPELAPSHPVVRRLTVADLDEPPAIEQADDVEMLTDKQRGRMFALWGELGYGDDSQRAERLAKTAKFIGVEAIETSNDLTREQADVVIARLLARKEQVAAAGGEPE